MVLADKGSRPMSDGRHGALCCIEGLSLWFARKDGPPLKAIDELSLDVMPGQSVGVVGESGSGKSMLALSILGLVPASATHRGRVVIEGIDVLSAPPRARRKIRGRAVGRRAHGFAGPIDDEITSTLRAVNLDADEIWRKYPFQLSGGMNQRVAIAMALLQRPQLLIADEPTTALDATVQVEILALLRAIQASRGMAFILISHDMAVVYQAVEMIAVMYAGRLVELGPAESLIKGPSHPYTKALIASIPRMGSTGGRLGSIPGQLTPRFAGDDGCPFRDRCPVAMPVCAEAFPPRDLVKPKHAVWCWDYSRHFGESSVDSA
jgi:peptide/nickel transport system ATP-binding protein